MRLAILFIALVALDLCHAIYQDEIGVYDWLKPLIGTPDNVLFGANQNFIYVSTLSNVISAIESTSNSIVWRHLLLPNDRIHTIKLSEDGIWTLSGSSHLYIRLWHAESGYLIWERAIDGTPASCNGFDITIVDDASAYILTNGISISKINIKTGQIEWNKSHFQAPICFSRVIANQNELFLVGSTSNITGGSLTSFPLYLENGEAKSKALTAADAKLASPLEFALILQESNLVVAYKDMKGKGWIFNLTSGRSIPIDFTPVSKDITVISKVSELVSETLLSELLVQTVAGSVVLVRVNDAGVVKVLKSFGYSTPPAVCALGSGQNVKLLSIEYNNASTVTLNIIETEKPNQKFTTVFDASQYGTITKVFARDDQMLVAVSSDGSMHLIKNKELLWTRHEFLTHITNSEFLELPVQSHTFKELDELNEPASGSATISLFTRYIRRWSTHIQKLSGFINQFLSPGLIEESSEAAMKVTRDDYSFRKFLIVTTSKGKIAALETGRGEIMWASMMGFHKENIVALKTLRTSLVKYPPIIGLVAISDNSTTIHEINGLSGHYIATARIHFVADRVILLPIETTPERHHVLALVDRNVNVQLHPVTKDTLNKFEKLRPSFYLTSGLSPGSQLVSGYALSSFNPSKAHFEAIQMWEINLPDGEVVCAVSENEHHDNIASIGRVLGNRAVLYKYLNPNQISFATLKSVNTTSTVSVYIIDGVTGTLLHHAIYYGGGVIDSAISNIHILQCENWVICTYWNHGPNAVDSEAQEQDNAPFKLTKNSYNKKKAAPSANIPDVNSMEIVVLELFESSKQNIRFEGEKFSSFDGLMPDVLSQAYQFPDMITGIGVTRTQAGISTREIILGTLSNHVYALNKRILDARRPMTPPTAEDQEEGLLPYLGFIPQNPKEILSYNQEVAGVQTIVSAPSILESTSIVLAYGLDLFCLRRAPSKTFDLLSQDFNRVNLIVTMAALGIAIYVVKYFNQRRQLFTAWK